MAGAGYRDWTAGDIPTADQFDTFLQHQTVMVFASAAARDTALSLVKSNGMYAYQTDSKRLWAYDGAAWNIVHEARQSWNLTAVTQSGSVSCTTTRGWYQRSHGVWRAQIALSITGTGVTNNAVTVGVPITLSDVNDVGGSWSFQDVSTGFFGAGTVIPSSTVTVGLLVGGQVTGSGQQQLGVGASGPAIGSGDALRLTLQGTYD